MQEVRKIKKQETAVISNHVFDNMRYKLSTHAQRLLYTIASNLSKDDELFPEMELFMPDMFALLGVENQHDKYKIVREAFIEIVKNPLEKDASYINRAGNYTAKWLFIPWFGLEYDEDIDQMIRLTFGRKAKAYLLQLKEHFVQIKLDYLLKLPSEYSTYLYPLIKSHYDRNKAHSKVVIFELSIMRLKQWTYVEEMTTYDPKKNKGANTDFLRKVIGIKRDAKTKKWDFTINKYKTKTGERTKYAGSLWEINENTDLKVTAIALKTGYAYDRVEFTVTSNKPERKKVPYKPRPKKGKILPDNFILGQIDIEFLTSAYPKAEWAEDVYKGYKKAVMLGDAELKKWIKMNSSVRHFLPVMDNKWLKWHVIAN